MQGAFPIEYFKNTSNFQMVIELETMIFEIDYAGENLQGRAEFLQKKAGYMGGRIHAGDSRV
jgi:hypothetical protein